MPAAHEVAHGVQPVELVVTEAAETSGTPAEKPEGQVVHVMSAVLLPAAA